MGLNQFYKTLEVCWLKDAYWLAVFMFLIGFGVGALFEWWLNRKHLEALVDKNLEVLIKRKRKINLNLTRIRLKKGKGSRKC